MYINLNYVIIMLKSFKNKFKIKPPEKSLSEQTGGYNFSIKEKNKIKLPACQTRCTTLHYETTFYLPSIEVIS